MRSTTHPVRGFLFLALCTALMFGTAVAYAAAGTTTRVSVSSAGTEGNIGSHSNSVSEDGRYVVFQSNWMFVAGDTNAVPDIFVRDRVAGTTIRASLDSTETQANNESYAPAISADGRYVAFSSIATNLVEGDSNGRADVFVRDLVAGTTTRVSVSSSEVEGDDYSESPSISADGHYVAFVSRATNFASGDTNDEYDVFVRDVRRRYHESGKRELDWRGRQRHEHRPRYLARWAPRRLLLEFHQPRERRYQPGGRRLRARCCRGHHESRERGLGRGAG